MLKVHYLEEIETEHIQYLTGLLSPKIILTTGEDLPQPADFHVLISGIPTENQFRAIPGLNSLIIPWAGLPQRTGKLLEKFPQIKIYNIHHNAQTTAEMAFSLMMMAAKRIIPIDRDFRKGDWSRRYQNEPILQLNGKTALVLGYGAIGQHIAKICKGIGMNIIAVRRSGENEAENIFKVSELNQLLPKVDVLFISVPHTPKTKGLIGKSELGLLPNDAVVVNIARGAVVDEQALFDEVASGRLRAGLDVWYNYPESEKEYRNCFPSDLPFHTLDNVVMTPHLAGHSSDIEKLRMEHLANLLNAIAEGDEIPNRVDLSHWY